MSLRRDAPAPRGGCVWRRPRCTNLAASVKYEQDEAVWSRTPPKALQISHLHSQELVHGESIENEKLYEGLPLHEKSLGHDHVQLPFLPHQRPATEDLLLRYVHTVPHHCKVHLRMDGFAALASTWACRLRSSPFRRAARIFLSKFSSFRMSKIVIRSENLMHSMIQFMNLFLLVSPI